MTTRPSSKAADAPQATALRPSGYLHAAYAASLAGHGAPLALPESGGWALVRDIAGTCHRDAMGLYPLLCCSDWRALASDLRALRNDLVSITAVTDPTGDYCEADLHRAFDRVTPFKEHFVVDTALPVEENLSKSHRRIARRALKDVDVDVCDRPADHLDEWMRLFETLSQRHAVSGLRAFSRAAFAMQLAVPGMTMFRATHQGAVVGLDLWYLQGNVAQGHLAAFSDLGYQLQASYATKQTLLSYFSERARLINLGGVAGRSKADAGSGLAQFKRGWSNATRTAYLCGSVLNPHVYQALAAHAPADPDASEYFPAYRAGELV